MAFENIDHLIFQMSQFRNVMEVESFRRANSTAITAFLHNHFGEDNIDHRSITKLFRDNGYPIDRAISINMSEAARAEKTQRTKDALSLKRRRALQNL